MAILFKHLFLQFWKVSKRGLHENCPNIEFFLVCIFLYLDWIRKFTSDYRKIRTRKNSGYGYFSRSEGYFGSTSFRRKEDQYFFVNLKGSNKSKVLKKLRTSLISLRSDLNFGKNNNIICLVSSLIPLLKDLSFYPSSWHQMSSMQQEDWVWWNWVPFIGLPVQTQGIV